MECVRANFNYEPDGNEAAVYKKMFTTLISNQWFLGGTVCEYHTQLPAYPWYALKPGEARSGIRNADYSDRTTL